MIEDETIIFEGVSGIVIQVLHCRDILTRLTRLEIDKDIFLAH